MEVGARHLYPASTSAERRIALARARVANVRRANRATPYVDEPFDDSGRLTDEAPPFVPPPEHSCYPSLRTGRVASARGDPHKHSGRYFVNPPRSPPIPPPPPVSIPSDSDEPPSPTSKQMKPQQQPVASGPASQAVRKQLFPEAVNAPAAPPAAHQWVEWHNREDVRGPAWWSDVFPEGALAGELQVWVREADATGRLRCGGAYVILELGTSRLRSALLTPPISARRARRHAL